MRRLSALLVVVALAVVAGLFARQRPVAVELELQLGTPPPTQVTLVFSRERVEHELTLSWPAGAPGRDHRSLRLPSGDYSVGVRLSPPERTFTRTLRIDEAGTYTLDLR